MLPSVCCTSNVKLSSTLKVGKPAPEQGQERLGKLIPSPHVYVKMIYGLCPVRIGVDGDSEAGFRDALVTGSKTRQLYHLTKHLVRGFRGCPVRC